MIYPLLHLLQKELHQMPHLPRKLMYELYQILSVSQKVIHRLPQMLQLPSIGIHEFHEIFCLPGKVQWKCDQLLWLPHIMNVMKGRLEIENVIDNAQKCVSILSKEACPLLVMSDCTPDTIQ